MAWQNPKTDWYGITDSEGVYTGDRFNARDYNRIKNNLEYLKDLANSLNVEQFEIIGVGEDKNPGSFYYADEINDIEINLETINANTMKLNIGVTKSYVENGNVPDFNELNRLEKATLDIYNRLSNQRDGRRKFTWNFGMKGDF